MYINLNGDLVNKEQFEIDISNRSFQYGDGLFETIIAKDGDIRLLPYHVERLVNGLNALHINHNFTTTNIEGYIQQLLSKNKLSNARIKLQVWRSDGGLYTPSNNVVKFLIIALPHELNQKKIDRCTFSEQITISYNSISKYKTCNSLPYILAALERDSKNLDEIIILNNEGHIAECSSSNIFWYKEGVYYTPSIQTGCIEGVMRKHVLSIAKKHQLIIKEGKYNKEDLLSAESAFTTNATGCTAIQNIDSKVFNTNIPIIPLLGL